MRKIPAEAIVRLDTRKLPYLVTVVKVLYGKDLYNRAVKETERLNAVNAGKNCSYHRQATRIIKNL